MKIENIVRNIPGDAGWGKPSSEKVFIGVGRFLLEKGLTIEEVEMVLGDVFNAVLSECED